jgi:hypothetical protein
MATVKVYWSHDDGALYLAEHLDDPINPAYFTEYEIRVPVTLSADQIACGQSSILECLLAAGAVVGRERES